MKDVASSIRSQCVFSSVSLLHFNLLIRSIIPLNHLLLLKFTITSFLNVNCGEVTSFISIDLYNSFEIFEHSIFSISSPCFISRLASRHSSSMLLHFLLFFVVYPMAPYSAHRCQYTTFIAHWSQRIPQLSIMSWWHPIAVQCTFSFIFTDSVFSIKSFNVTITNKVICDVTRQILYQGNPWTMFFVSRICGRVQVVLCQMNCSSNYQFLHLL